MNTITALFKKVNKHIFIFSANGQQAICVFCQKSIDPTRKNILRMKYDDAVCELSQAEATYSEKTSNSYRCKDRREL